MHLTLIVPIALTAAGDLRSLQTLTATIETSTQLHMRAKTVYFVTISLLVVGSISRCLALSMPMYHRVKLDGIKGLDSLCPSEWIDSEH